MRGRAQYLIVFCAFLLALAALCFWAGFGFALVISLLLLAGLVPIALLAGHRYVNRWYVVAEIVALVVALAISVVSGSLVAWIIVGTLFAMDTLACSALVLARGRGGMRAVTRNLLLILAALGAGTGAYAIAAAVAPVPSCGTATVGRGGATTPEAAEAGQCFVASGESCVPKTLTVRATGVDELATHRFVIVADSDGQCHFTDSVQYGPPSDPSRHSTSYTCPALTDQIGAPGEQQVQLTQCSGAVVPGVAAPVIPLNEYQPLPSPTPSSG